MNNNNIDNDIISLYNAQKWEEIAALSSTTDDFRTCRLSWVLPDISDLCWINKIIQKYNLTKIASIGCGCGLLEWLLQKYSGKPLFQNEQILIYKMDKEEHLYF